MRLSIRTQLLLLIALASVPLAGAVAWDVYSDVRTSEETTRAALRALASAMESNTRGRLVNAQRTMQRLEDELLDEPLDPAHCERVLTQALLSCQYCFDLFVTDPAGTIRCAARAGAGQQRAGSVADTPWYQQLRARGTFTASNPIDDALSGERLVVLSVPFFEGAGALRQAMHTTFKLDALDPRLPATLLPENSRYAFVSPERVLVWRNVDPEQVVGKPLPQTLTVPALENPGGDFQTMGLDGVERQFATAPMPLTGWVAMVGVPAAGVREQPLMQARRNAQVSALAIGVLAALALLLARRIASPIVALEQVARAAVEPGFSGRATPSGSRELDAVAVALNALLDERRDREEQLRAFLDNSAVIAWMKDEQGRYVFGSRYFLSRFALTPERLVGKTDDEIWPRELADRFRAWDARVLSDGHPFEHLKQLPNPDGTVSSWHTSKFLFTAPDGRKLVGALGVDITQLRKAEEALRVSDVRLETIFDTSPIGMSLGSLENKYLRVNQAFCRMLGRTEEEMKALGPFGITAPGDQQSGHEELAALLAGKRQSSTVEKRYVHKSGREVWVLRTLSVVRDAQGKPLHYLGQVQDISERKAAEESARLAVVGTLAAGAAHEINNPLTYVLGNLAWVREELTALEPYLPASEHRRVADALEAIVEAHGGAERIAHIIAGLKSFARKSDQPREPTDVARVMDSALQLTVAQRRNQAQTEMKYTPAPRALVNPRQLEQVFINLLVNAAQAIPEGHADEHRITVTVKPGDGGSVVAEVTDTGAGMSDEVKAHLFEPFFTTKAIGAGTGLGLSTCHGIVTSFGGHIEVETAPGRGSTFRVVLPGLPTVEAPAAVAVPPAPELPRRGRVLIIDDEAAVARGLSRSLQGGPEVVIETDPRSALARLERGETFDLVLCDVMMPSLPGEELQKALRKTRPEVAEAIVFMTGGTFTSSAMSFLEATKNLCLQKPIDAPTLRGLVSERLARNRTA